MTDLRQNQQKRTTKIKMLKPKLNENNRLIQSRVKYKQRKAEQHCTHRNGIIENRPREHSGSVYSQN